MSSESHNRQHTAFKNDSQPVQKMSIEDYNFGCDFDDANLRLGFIKKVYGIISA